MITSHTAQHLREIKDTLAYLEEKFPGGFEMFWSSGRPNVAGGVVAGQTLIVALKPMTEDLIREWVRPALDKIGIQSTKVLIGTDELICYIGPAPILSLVIHFETGSHNEKFFFQSKMDVLTTLARFIEPLFIASHREPEKLIIPKVKGSDGGWRTSIGMRVLIHAIKRTVAEIPKGTSDLCTEELEFIVKYLQKLPRQQKFSWEDPDLQIEPF